MLTRASRRLLAHPVLPEHTWTPFLYCTPTIVRRYGDSKPPPQWDGAHVPFEGIPERRTADLPPDDDDSTITPRERQAFKTLLNLPRKEPAAGPPKSPEDGKTPREKKPSSSGRRRGEEPDELEDMLTNAMSTAQQLRQPRRINQPPRDFPDPLLDLVANAEERRARERHRRQEQQLAARGRAHREDALLRAVDRDFATFALELYKARTDVEVWGLLQRGVLDRVRGLRLDDVRGIAQRETRVEQKPADEDDAGTITVAAISSDPPASSGPDPAPRTPSYPPGREPPSDLQILTTTLPRHLVRIQFHLNSAYPGSAYRLAVLPTLRALGPGAFALGASTGLYNQHMRAWWEAYGASGLGELAKLLAEMEREVYVFDEGTHGLLRRVLAYGQAARRGLRGEGARALWAMPRVQRETRELFRWAKAVEARREEEAMRVASERASVQRAERERGMVAEEMLRSAVGEQEVAEAEGNEVGKGGI